MIGSVDLPASDIKECKTSASATEPEAHKNVINSVVIQNMGPASLITTDVWSGMSGEIDKLKNWEGTRYNIKMYLSVT